jgi:hypothetical protein
MNATQDQIRKLERTLARIQVSREKTKSGSVLLRLTNQAKAVSRQLSDLYDAAR